MNDLLVGFRIDVTALGITEEVVESLVATIAVVIGSMLTNIRCMILIVYTGIGTLSLLRSVVAVVGGVSVMGLGVSCSSIVHMSIGVIVGTGTGCMIVVSKLSWSIQVVGNHTVWIDSLHSSIAIVRILMLFRRTNKNRVICMCLFWSVSCDI